MPQLVLSALLASAALGGALQLCPPGLLSSIGRHSMSSITASVLPCTIKVIGIGGGGGNTVNRMTDAIGTGDASGVQFVCMNTDVQALARSQAKETLQLGPECTRGLGAGGKPHVGERAAVESAEAITNCVAGQDMVFVTAGMGGGTGSGAAPVVAQIARESGALTVGVVSTPFGFEGAKRTEQATDAIERLRYSVDMIVVISNDRLLEIIPPGVSLADSFALADEVLRQGIVGISDIITKTGLVNVDFADVRSIVADSGLALMGVGRGFGKARAEEAAEAAITSPLLSLPLVRAKRAVFTVVGGPTLSLQEVNKVATTLNALFDPDANIIFGATVDEEYGDEELMVTIVATDFGEGVDYRSS